MKGNRYSTNDTWGCLYKGVYLGSTQFQLLTNLSLHIPPLRCEPCYHQLRLHTPSTGWWARYSPPDPLRDPLWETLIWCRVSDSRNTRMNSCCYGNWQQCCWYLLQPKIKNKTRYFFTFITLHYYIYVKYASNNLHRTKNRRIKVKNIRPDDDTFFRTITRKIYHLMNFFPISFELSLKTRI